MRWVGLVRNIMLGRDGIDRELLVAAVADAGGARVRSHLTTGNVTFEVPARDVDALVRRLEARVSEIVSRPTMVAVREQSWLQDLVATELFEGPDRDEHECEVAFLRRGAPVLDPSRVPRTGRTRLVAIRERELASVRPRSGPQRPHVTRLLEAATSEPATTRGWSTLCRLAGAD